MKKLLLTVLTTKIFTPAAFADFVRGQKKLILLLTLASSLATAQNYQNSPTEMSYTIVQLSSVDANLASIRLNDSGVVTLTKHDRSFKSFKLSEANQQEIFWLAGLLTEVELEIETRHAVCEILLPSFAIQNLKVFDTSERAVKLVLSSSSCALPSYTHPKEEHLTEAARVLRARLIALAQDLL